MKQESVGHQLVCPRCGNSGQGTLFEDHNPAHPEHIARRVETLPKGMAGGAIDADGNQQVICEICSSQVPI
ncbi:MAG TPA: hypothetical protein VH722_00405 [Alphaproteobacteria bacterium]|jgi:hypothetical protein|nr:hypothetical protein [Alphaproteobacteria bacterium]